MWCVSSKVAFVFSRIRHNTVTQVGESPHVFSKLGHRPSFNDLVDCFDRRPHWQANSVIVIDAFTVKDTVSEADPETQRSKVVVRKVVMALRVSLIERGYRALHAEVTHAHPIAERAWPRPT